VNRAEYAKDKLSLRERHRAEVYAVNALLKQVELNQFHEFVANARDSVTQKSDRLSVCSGSSDDSSSLPDIKAKNARTMPVHKQTDHTPVNRSRDPIHLSFSSQNSSARRFGV